MLPANFNQLYYFWIITKAGSINAATKPLLLGQSTLSQQLKTLETSLGHRLLERSRRGLSLTSEGTLAFEYCERIFSQAEELLGLLKGGDAPRLHILRIGASRTLPREKILELSRQVRSRDPGITVKIVSGDPAELEELLATSRLDLLMIDADPQERGSRSFRSRLATSIPHFFVAARSLGAGPSAFPGCLGRHPLLLRISSHPIRRDVDYFLRRNGIVPDILAELDDADILLGMVLRGEGIGVIGQDIVESKKLRRRLIRLHERPVGIRQNIWLVCRAAQSGSPRVQKLLEEILADFRFA